MPLADKLTKKGQSIVYYRRLKEAASRPMAKISGLISLTLLTIAFFGMFAILPTLRTIGKLNKEVEDAETVKTKLEQKTKALKQAQEVYDQVASEVGLVNWVLPEGVMFERLAWQVSYLAYESQVKVGGISFEAFLILGDEQPEGEKILSLPFDLTISGSYVNLARFLGGLNRVDRLIIIDDVNLSSGRQAEGGVTATVKATAYYLPVNKADVNQVKLEE